MKNVFKHLIYGKNKKIKESQILYCSENMPQRAINEIMLKATFNGKLNDEIYKFFPLEHGEYVLLKTTLISGKKEGYADDRHQVLTHALIFNGKNAEILINDLDFVANINFVESYDDIERIKKIDKKQNLSWEDLLKSADDEKESVSYEEVDYERLKYILISLIENRQLIMAHNHVSTLNGIFNGVPRSIAKRMSLTFFANTAEEANSFKLIIFTDKAFDNLRMSMFMGMEVNPIVYGEKPTLEDKTVDIVNKYIEILDDDSGKLEKLSQECSSTSEFFSKIYEYPNEEINNEDEDNRLFMEELEREIEKYNKKKNKVLAKRFINKVVFSLLLVVTIAFIASSSEISLHKAVLNISINASFVSGVILGFLVSSLKNLLGKDGRI